MALQALLTGLSVRMYLRKLVVVTADLKTGSALTSPFLPLNLMGLLSLQSVPPSPYPCLLYPSPAL